ncbi:TetR/AcrR family transcriptional regulator [Paenibacillus senegalensis]|uniref:TetR/AcrR family transcriptional regulator n=1 Tax=Paenibacillus senegalensis TaxID=1465766 RepID=UPI000288ADFF|nr:TetR/AcrR family transcriptional regulator [Paenibacillus senegalensis]
MTDLHDKRLEKGGQTRQRIIDAAISLAAASGVQSVSAAKLAEVAEVSKSNVFHHFKTIEELLSAALQQLTDIMLETMRTKFSDAEQFLDQIGKMFVSVQEQEQQEQQATLFKTFLSFYHEGLFDARYAEILEQSRVEMLEVITIQLRHVAVDVDQEQLEAASALLLSLWDGLGLHYMSSGNHASIENAWKLQAELFRKQFFSK